MAKFETNLSQKDKMTIVGFLAFAGVFMFAWFGIRPAVTDIKSLSDDIDHATVVEAQYRNKIINLSSSEAIFERAVSDLNDTTADFYEKMPSSSIDRMMTNYVLGFGLYPEDLYIGMPNGPVEEVPYIYSEAMARQVSSVVEEVTEPTPTPIEVSIGLSSGSSSSTQTAESGSAGSNFAAETLVESLVVPYTSAMNSAGSTSSSGVEAVDITMIMTGNPDTCQALIDDLSTQPSVRITGFTWSAVDQVERINEETGEVELVDSDDVRLKVDIRLYMVDIVDYEASVTEAVEAVAAEG